MGARRIGVTSLPPLGCLPATIRLYGKGRSGCVERLNGDAETFNNKLNITVEALAKKHSDLKIAIFDIYTPLRNMSESPLQPGDGGVVPQRQRLRVLRRCAPFRGGQSCHRRVHDIGRDKPSYLTHSV